MLKGRLATQYIHFTTHVLTILYILIYMFYKISFMNSIIIITSKRARHPHTILGFSFD